MKIVEVLPVRIATFDCPDGLVNKYLQIAKNIKFKELNAFSTIPSSNNAKSIPGPAWGLTQSTIEAANFQNGSGGAFSGGYGWKGLDNEECKDLFDWLNSCLEEVRKQFRIPFEKITATNAWVNKQTKNSHHSAHTHPASVISGIIYLSSHDDGETIFANEDLWRDSMFFIPSKRKQYSYIKPKAGKTILFPSKLEHAVPSYGGEDGRYTIAFNSFPEGVFGTFTQGLEIKSSNSKLNSKEYITNINISQKFKSIEL